MTQATISRDVPVRQARILLSLAVVTGGALLLGACQSASPIPADLADAAKQLTSVTAPANWEAQSYPTNNSLIETVNGVPVDYTGSLTKRTTATVVYLSRPVAQENLEEYCQEAMTYLKSLERAIGAPWQGEGLRVDTCLDSLMASQEGSLWETTSEGIDYTARLESATNGSQGAIAIALSAHLTQP